MYFNLSKETLCTRLHFYASILRVELANSTLLLVEKLEQRVLVGFPILWIGPQHRQLRVLDRVWWQEKVFIEKGLVSDIIKNGLLTFR